METWKFHSFYPVNFIGDGKTVILRRPDPAIFYCWANRAASEIILASSTKLVKDVYQEPITTIPAASEKLSQGYSILVKQYALTEEAFNFGQLVKKNTEQLGTIFFGPANAIAGDTRDLRTRYYRVSNIQPVLC